jgi:hypothetical protein
LVSWIIFIASYTERGERIVHSNPMEKSMKATENVSWSMRALGKLALALAATAGLFATAGVGAAITATPASALPKCSAAYLQQQRDDSEYWIDEALQWARWADDDAYHHDWEAYGLDVHNELVAHVQFSAAQARLVACL